MQRNGNLNRAYVNGNENGVNLNWNWTDNRWNRNCRFVFVCNSLLAPTVTLWECCFPVASAIRQAFDRSPSAVQISLGIFCCPML